MMPKASAERQRAEFQTELLHHRNSCVRDCELFRANAAEPKGPKERKKTCHVIVLLMKRKTLLLTAL